MSVQIRYMGAKHSLAPTVAEIIKELPSGPCLDLFAGMCSVAGAIAASGRETWCNDIQKYAALVSNVLVALTELPLTSEQVSSKLLPAFKRNAAYLKRRFAVQLQEEALALRQESFTTYKDLSDNWQHAGNNPVIAREILSLRYSSAFPYRLATLTYSYGYFGLLQAIELDSLRYAIDYSYRKNQLSIGQAQQCLTALMEISSKICTAPGHFAQYLEAKNISSWRHIRAQRSRGVWAGFISSLESISAYGTKNWRAKNRIFCQDAMRLPNELNNSGNKPKIIYADPPYSEAQYSRYYHVLENLVKYDYPAVMSKGRYDDARFTTPFSLVSSVGLAFVNLVKSAARLEADLVISYPSNGLLFYTGGNLSSILHDYYSRVNIIKISHKHSTLGGKHGRMTSDVEELIFVAKNQRR